MAAFNDLKSQDPSTRDRGVDAVLTDRKSVIQRLIPIVDPANVKEHTDETRSAAAYLLGELRAVESVTSGLGRRAISPILQADRLWTA